MFKNNAKVHREICGIYFVRFHLMYISLRLTNRLIELLENDKSKRRKKKRNRVEINFK